jgi:hypothetical protein
MHSSIDVFSKAIQKARRMAQRVRAPIACSQCKVKKSKCSQHRPCKRCVGLGTPCQDQNDGFATATFRHDTSWRNAELSGHNLQDQEEHDQQKISQKPEYTNRSFPYNSDVRIHPVDMQRAALNTNLSAIPDSTINQYCTSTAIYAQSQRRPSAPYPSSQLNPTPSSVSWGYDPVIALSIPSQLLPVSSPLPVIPPLAIASPPTAVLQLLLAFAARQTLSGL